jgi:uncharacterized protein YbbC (DUF1343 family)
MQGWNRSMYFKDTGLPWIAPSPNLPTPVSTMVYPGQVLWEGTNVSEGRGTTQPFELFGAPYFNLKKVLAVLKGDRMPGAILRPAAFEPAFNKWQGKLCRGFQIHITDPHQFQPYITALKLIQAVRFQHRDQFKWKPPPYEYEFDRLPIDLLIGDQEIRKRLENFDAIDEIEKSWQDDLSAFIAMSRKYHLYK